MKTNAMHNVYKVGRSINPKVREKTLAAEKEDVELLFVCEQNIEKELHSLLNEYRVRGEWFFIKETELAKIVEKYSFKSVN